MKRFDLENYGDKAIAAITVDADEVTLTGTSGTANVTVNGVAYLATWGTDLPTTAAAFVTSHKAALAAKSILVFSAKQTETITLTGTNGTANVTVAGGLTKLATWNTSLTITASDFVTAHAAAYLEQGIVVTSSTADLVFTGLTSAVRFTPPVITNVTLTLDGTGPVHSMVNSAAIAFVHKRSRIMTNRIVASIAAATGNLNGTLAATFKPDFNVARVFQLILNCAFSIAAPSNLRDGQNIRFELTASGAYAVTWNGGYRFAGGTEHTQTSTALDIIEGLYNEAAKKVYCTVVASDVKF